MKKISLLLLCLTLIQCQGQKEKETITNEPMKEYKYKTDKRMVYGIDLTVPGPFELYINDIVARKDYSPAMHNTLVDINPLVLKSGKYKFKFKFRLLPMPSELEKGGIQPETLKFLHVALAQYEKVKEGAEPNTYKVTFQYPIPVIDKPVPFLDIEGEFEVALPYELEGWSKGQDLSKMDKDQLKEKVVKHYEKLWNVLNDGNYSQWEALTEKRREETYIFNYTLDSVKNETLEENKKDILKCEQKMAPIEDYEMNIYGNGRLISLERKSYTQSFNDENDMNIKGWSPLIRKFKVSGGATYSVILYLPEGSDEFVIIRK